MISYITYKCNCIFFTCYVYIKLHMKYMRNDKWNSDTISELWQYRNIGNSGSKYRLHVQWMERWEYECNKTRLCDDYGELCSILQDQYVYIKLYRLYVRNNFMSSDTVGKLWKYMNIGNSDSKYVIHILMME